MRSMLFVPGDSARKQEKSLQARADALILDLEDSVAPPQKSTAREMTLAFLTQHGPSARHPLLYVRVNALDTGLTDLDLEAVMPGRPAGIMIPKAVGGKDMADICARLTKQEKQNGIAEGSTRLIPVATESAAAVLALPTIPGSTSRMSGLTWGGEDLAADIGAESNHDESGAYTPTYVMARSMALLTAVAAGVEPIETAYVNYGDAEGFMTDCLRARRDGFTGRIAIHPNQVDIINDIFTPSKQAVERATKIIDTFAANPGMGVIGIDGEMIEIPHLRQSERIIQRHKAIIALTQR